MLSHSEAAGKTALIADDDPRVLAMLGQRLRAVGFNVVQCQDAYMAVEMARRHNPDVIILDVNMPAGQGGSAHERLSNIPETAKIPVIYLTGNDSQKVRDQAEKLGAWAFIRKPYDIADLLAHVLSAVRKRAA